MLKHNAAVKKKRMKAAAKNKKKKDSDRKAKGEPVQTVQDDGSDVDDGVLSLVDPAYD